MLNLATNARKEDEYALAPGGTPTACPAPTARHPRLPGTRLPCATYPAPPALRHLCGTGAQTPR
ncbi:hypothetical protein GCM10018785_06920 [Streptomyces longispororuber]|uniref:Uncharacterized protein n=1 Tax=Streptomyces longispororuber TaxID=68230 RepID=A0A918Z8F0_9ACTN|nr:hypothetical protein GCM10018785_06920 [Streptomyces longispororuber]